VLRAAEGFGFDGQLVEGLRFYGSQVDVLVAVDDVEVARRQATGLGPLLDRQLLTALASLPHGHRVRWDDIDPVLHPVLDCAPAGVLHRDPTAVTVRWRPAARVVGVLATAGRDWRAGVSRVGIFRRDAACALLLARPPLDLGAVLSRTSRFGIGLALPGQHGWEVYVDAEPTRLRVDATHWRLLETAYAGWLSQHQADVQPSSAHHRR
jgi:hypothetical protein